MLMKLRVSKLLDVVRSVWSIGDRFTDAQDALRSIGCDRVFALSAMVAAGTVTQAEATAACYRFAGMVDRRAGMRAVSEAMAELGLGAPVYNWSVASELGLPLEQPIGAAAAAMATMSSAAAYQLAERLLGHDVAEALLERDFATLPALEIGGVLGPAVQSVQVTAPEVVFDRTSRGVRVLVIRVGSRYLVAAVAGSRVYQLRGSEWTRVR